MSFDHSLTPEPSQDTPRPHRRLNIRQFVQNILDIIDYVLRQDITTVLWTVEMRWLTIQLTLQLFDIQIVHTPEQTGAILYAFKYRGRLYASGAFFIQEPYAMNLSNLARTSTISHACVNRRFRHMSRFLGLRRPYADFLDPVQRNSAINHAKLIIIQKLPNLDPFQI